jgi:hypothetical protein
MEPFGKPSLLLISCSMVYNLEEIMKTKVFQTLIRGSMVFFLLLIAVFRPTSSFAENSHNLIIQDENGTPLELQPGDVINLSGGIAILTGVTTIWGHSAMYLGIVDGKKMFLDFTTPKKEHTNKNDLYQGRILNEIDFLSENLSHEKFDVFRFISSNTETIIKVDQCILATEAKKIAKDGTWFLINNCAHVVANILSAATNDTQFDVWTPDGFDKTSWFSQLAGGRVNIKAALNNAKKKLIDSVPPAPPFPISK